MRILRTLLIIVLIVAAVAVLAGALFVASVNNRHFARPEAVAALESDGQVTVSGQPGEDWIVFSPADETPRAGFVLYPGGLVDPAAYAPFARDIAADGYLVVIDPMPLNLAVLNINGADDILSAFPDVDAWAIGGHSLGGAMAAQYIAGNPDAMDGLALWAAFPAQNTDLSGFELEAVSIYGDADGVAAVADVRGAAERLPPDTTFVTIPGGNHTQFGWYGDGLQRGDNPAGISREAQQQIVVDSTSAMLAAVAGE